ncbi:Thiamine monophosphate kinase ThiL [Methanonatronarchaeum thermophilum]|uniref:Thiamine-monophosphate kinase n=1 Tax=Methanonatronarchaeum thermophilum TaxID=1927129 RepID=A0A1Y3G9X0_9EURY|nr:thiamine-phosphate kinase [Methanonatronarchaeum thermophilum]OUJ18228.1 Thiamine monophosphate kinase ThiL [Methanonatronarchaeum thermophilum]
MRLNNLGEIGAIKKITQTLDIDSQKIIRGPGEDDCAVVRTNNEKLLFASDMLTRTRHLPKEMPYHNIGWTAVAVNLSDIAAMGGHPLFLTSSIGTPNITKEQLTQLTKGMNECSRKHDSYIVGGDLCQHREIVINCSIIGKPTKNTLYRDGANPQEYLAVTGQVGTAGLAAKTITGKHKLPEKVRKKAFKQLFKPNPRIKEGQYISKNGGTSAIDVSDGLLHSTKQLSNASKIGINIDSSKIPIDPEIKSSAKKNNIDIMELIDIGGDYEILFTTKKPNKIPENASIIGKTKEKQEVTIDHQKIDTTGYDHFKPENPKEN